MILMYNGNQNIGCLDHSPRNGSKDIILVRLRQIIIIEEIHCSSVDM